MTTTRAVTGNAVSSMFNVIRASFKPATQDAVTVTAANTGILLSDENNPKNGHDTGKC